MASISDTHEINDENELSGDEDTNTILYTAIQSTPMCMTITTSSKSSTRKRKHRLKEDNKNKNRKKSDSSEDVKLMMKTNKTDNSTSELLNTTKNLYSSRLLKVLQSEKTEISKENLKITHSPLQLKIDNSQVNRLMTKEKIDARVIVAEVSGLFLLFNEYLQEKKQCDILPSETSFLFKYIVSNRLIVCIDARKHNNITKFVQFSDVNSNVELTHTFKNDKFRIHIITKQQIDAEQEILLDTKHSLKCLSVESLDVKATLKNLNNESAKSYIVNKSEFRRLSPIKLTIPKVANFSDDEDIKHEVRSKNDSTKELINKHTIRKDSAVVQENNVDKKTAVCLPTPLVKKRPTVRVTEPSKQHRKKRGRSRGWKHKQIHVQEIQNSNQNQSVGSVNEGIKEFSSEKNLLPENNGKNKLETKNQYFKKYLPQPYRPPTEQEVARFCTTQKPWQHFDYNPGFEPSNGFRISFVSKSQKSKKFDFDQNTSKNPKKHFLAKAQIDSKLLEVTNEEASKVIRSKFYGKLKTFILSKYNSPLLDLEINEPESFDFQPHLNTEQKRFTNEPDKIYDDNKISDYNPFPNKKKVTLSLAQYRSRKHNVSSPGISSTSDKMFFKDQNLSDDEQNISLSTKKVTDVQTVAEKQTKVKVLIKSTSNLPDIISEQQLIPNTAQNYSTSPMSTTSTCSSKSSQYSKQQGSIKLRARLIPTITTNRSRKPSYSAVSSRHHYDSSPPPASASSTSYNRPSPQQQTSSKHYQWSSYHSNQQISSPVVAPSISPNCSQTVSSPSSHEDSLYRKLQNQPTSAEYTYCVSSKDFYSEKK